MKKSILIALSWMFFAGFVYCQQQYMSTDVQNVIYTTDFSGSCKKVDKFIKANHVTIQSQNVSKAYLKVNMILDYALFAKYDSLVNELGYSTSKQVDTKSDLAKIAEINLQLDYLKKQKESYADLLKRLDEKAENYLSIWREQKEVEEKIYNLEKELIGANKKEDTFVVSLEVNDEVTSPQNSKISFVNMPGFEYSYLQIENPGNGISAENYQGYFLKYLFTKGKSYATIGVYKSMGLASNDSSSFSELFVIGFGQDFYSRHLGRGSRHFFNLYSGYTVGTIFASSKSDKSNTFFIAPSIGLELYKNKFMLLDSKVNYFVPLKNNRNLRGFSYNVSLNFVF
jgi:hypothetical protein